MLSRSFDQRDIIPSEEYMELSWEMFGELCRALALKVAAAYDPEIIIGVARAGVIPGAVIASILRRDFFSLKITRREGGQVVRQRPSILTPPPPARPATGACSSSTRSPPPARRCAWPWPRCATWPRPRCAPPPVSPGRAATGPTTTPWPPTRRSSTPGTARSSRPGGLVVNPRYRDADA